MKSSNSRKATTISPSLASSGLGGCCKSLRDCPVCLTLWWRRFTLKDHTWQTRLMFGSPSLRQIVRRSKSTSLAQKSVAVAAAIMYFAVASGMPLPVAKQTSTNGELFPCASSGCGCDSAEKCWRSCCCHTLAERLAWAEKYDVKPPAFALAEAASAGLDSGGRPLTQKVIVAVVVNRVALTKKSCCQAKHSCCESAAKSHSCCSSHKKQDDQQQATTFIVAWRALGCHGHSLNWLAAVPSLLSVELNLSDQLPLVTWLGPHSSEVAAGVSDVPTPPPPERA